MQNLIPLLFRPLRLCVPAEKLRALRIVTLKVTHFPFVLAIQAYENGRNRFAGQGTARSTSKTSIGGLETGVTLARPLASSMRSPIRRPPLLMHSSSQERSREAVRCLPHRSSDTTEAPSMVDVEKEMERLAQEMQVRLSELRAMIERRSSRAAA